MQRSNVDLPLPDEPMRQTTSRSATSRSIPSSTAFGPNALRTPTTCSFAIGLTAPQSRSCGAAPGSAGGR